MRSLIRQTSWRCFNSVTSIRQSSIIALKFQVKNWIVFVFEMSAPLIILIVFFCLTNLSIKISKFSEFTINLLNANKTTFCILCISRGFEWMIPISCCRSWTSKKVFSRVSRLKVTVLWFIDDPWCTRFIRQIIIEYATNTNEHTFSKCKWTHGFILLIGSHFGRFKSKIKFWT